MRQMDSCSIGALSFIPHTLLKAVLVCSLDTNLDVLTVYGTKYCVKMS